MRKLLSILLLVITGCGGHVTSTNGTASVSIPWTLPSGCTISTCEGNVYRAVGSCPEVGWSLLGQTTDTTFIDTTVTKGITYSYAIELTNPTVPNSFSGPSNCRTINP